MSRKKKVKKAKKTTKKSLSRWGFPKIAPEYYESPWPMSAATKKLYVAFATVGAEIADLELAMNHWAQKDPEQHFLDDGTIYREMQILQKRLKEAEDRFGASYRIDEAKAKAAPVVDIVRKRRVERDHDARPRKKPR